MPISETSVARVQHEDPPFPGTLIVDAHALAHIGRDDRVGLAVEQASEDEGSAWRCRGGEGGGKSNQRSSQYIGDDEIERRPRINQRMIHAIGRSQQQFARSMSDPHSIDRSIFRAHPDGDLVNVGGDRPCLRPQRQRGEGEQPGTGADVGDVGVTISAGFELVQR